MKKFVGDIILLHMCTRNHNHTMYGSWDMAWDRHNFFVILSHFLPFYHPPPILMIPKIKILKTKKMQKMPGDIILLCIHVYHKSTSYDIWFLKYKVWQTEIFVFLGHFLPFQPPDNLESQNFKIEKSTSRYYHFTHLHHKWWCMITELWSTTDWMFCHSGPFFALYLPPLWTQKIKILKKWKKHLEISFYKCVP